MPLHLALYQPDIPQNTGTLIRFAACIGLEVDIIEPAGFPVSDRAFRRAGMDYLDHITITRHINWQEFRAFYQQRRVILLTTKARQPYTSLTYNKGDILLLGRESAGVPDHVHQEVDQRILIPMRPALRSINVALSAAMVAGEALRQTGDNNAEP